MLKKWRIVVNPDSVIKEMVLHYVHANPLLGHSVYLKTYQNAKHDFYGVRMKNDIKIIVKKCEVCQTMKCMTTPQ